jgi:hypothetical protein
MEIMAKQNTTAKVKTTTEKMTADGIISHYMEYVLENEKEPKSIYKFSKDSGITEDEFYEHFGSFEGLKKDIWKRFFSKSMDVIKKSPEFESFTGPGKNYSPFSIHFLRTLQQTGAMYYSYFPVSHR